MKKWIKPYLFGIGSVVLVMLFLIFSFCGYNLKEFGQFLMIMVAIIVDPKGFN